METQPGTAAEVIPYIFYRDVPAALAWLARVFCFTEEMRHATPGGGMHAQMRVGGRRIMMGVSSEKWNMRTPAEIGTPTQGVFVFVYVDDVAAMHARAVAEGAVVDGPPTNQGYGATFTARDLDDHPWFFTQRQAD